MEDKANNRSQILCCAKHLFYQKGYDAVGVQEIATAAGVTKPTLYYYFKSKIGLLEALLEEQCDPICDRLNAVVDDYSGDPPNTLYQMAKEYVDIASEDREFYFLLLSLNYFARENEAYIAGYPYMKKIFFAMKRLFELADSELGNMNGRQEQFALSFLGVINHYILVMDERGVEKEELTNAKKIQDLVKQFMYGIYS